MPARVQFFLGFLVVLFTFSCGYFHIRGSVVPGAMTLYRPNDYEVKSSGMLCVKPFRRFEMRLSDEEWFKRHEEELWLRWWREDELLSYLVSEFEAAGFSSRVTDDSCSGDVPVVECAWQDAAMDSRWIPLNGKLYRAKGTFLCKLFRNGRPLLERTYVGEGIGWFPIYTTGDLEAAECGAQGEASKKFAQALVTDVIETIETWESGL